MRKTADHIHGFIMRIDVAAGKQVILWITNAALLVTIAECLYVSMRDVPDPVVFASIFNIVSVNALFLCVISFLSFVVLAAGKDVRLVKGNLASMVFGAVLFSLPHAYILFNTLPERGIVFYCNVLVFAALLVVGALVGARSAMEIPWISFCAVGCLSAFGMLTGSYYVLDIDPARFNMYFFYTTGVSLTSPLIALLLYRSFGASVGKRESLPLAVGATLAALAVCYVGMDLLPEISGSFLFFIAAISSVAFVLGMSRIGPIRNFRYAAVVLGFAVAAQVFMVAAPDEGFRSRWTISMDTVFPGLLVRYSPFSRLSDRLTGDVVPQKEMTSRANRWNQGLGADKRFARDSVLLITVDSLRYRSVGYAHLEPTARTPRIDRLAKDSFRFHQTYTQGGWTSLAIPALFWGKHTNSIAFAPLYEAKDMTLYFEGDVPPNARIRAVYQSPRNESTRSLTELLRGEGYKTIAVINDGITSYFEKKFGFTRGFDVIRYPSGTKDKKRRARDERLRKRPLDTLTADYAIEELRKARNRKFFMWVHMYAPHWTGESCFPGATRLDCYQKVVSETDRQVGRVLDELGALRKADDTIVVLSADHGQLLGEHREQAHGKTLYEEATRIPLLIRVPGVQGRDIRQPSALIDIAPTILSYAGAEIPQAMQGFSQRPIMEGSTGKVRPPVFTETWRREVKTHDMRLHLVSVVDNRYKLICDKLTGAYSLFDLRRDEGERRNLLKGELSAKNRARFRRLYRYINGYGDPIYVREK
jgi:arylsulfatase A-like enzyme